MARRITIAIGTTLLALAGCAPVQRPAPIPAEPVDTLSDRALPPPPASGAPPAEAPLPEEGALHVVRPGETLYRIALGYGVTVEAIVVANEIADPDSLEVGQVLLVPGATASIGPPPGPGPPPGTASGYAWPVPGGSLLAGYGQPRRRHRHSGLDIGAVSGTEVLAARDGTVLHSGDGLRGYGRTVIVDHGDGWRTLYAHNRRVLVQAGDRVARGQPIAEVGRTGNATTEHVHFEIRHGDRPVDPLPLLEGIAGRTDPGDDGVRTSSTPR